MAASCSTGDLARLRRTIARARAARGRNSFAGQTGTAAAAPALVYSAARPMASAFAHSLFDAIDVRATIPSRRDDPIGRLHARICEACGGTDGPFEMHHSQTLADMRHDLRGLPVLPPRWRKTLVLCRTCREVRHRQQ